MTKIAVLALFAAVATAFAQNTFHGNNARTGVYDSPGPKRLGGVKWVFKAGGPIVTSPAIADGKLLLRGRKGISCYSLTAKPAL